MTERPFTASFIARTFDYLPQMAPHEVDGLYQSGVPMDALMRPTLIKAAHVVFDQHRFEFEHQCRYGTESIRALVFLIIDPWGDPRDIVAWSHKTSQLACWYGQAWAIGQETIYDVRLSGHGALPIWRDPLGLLRANREGLVLLRPHVAAHYLNDVGPLFAEDSAHGLELQALLSRPQLRILVPAPDAIAA
jgi:hypothetical protein